MKRIPQRGSVLIATLFFLTVVIVGVAAVFDLSNGAYKLARRNEYRAEARAVAETEMEYLYAEFAAIICNGGSPSSVPSTMSGICDVGSTPTTLRVPFAQIHQNQAGGWKVLRSIETDVDSVQGKLPQVGNQATKWGKFSYYTCKVEVIPDQSGSSYYRNSQISVRIGRHFSNSSSSIFQYSIFFQGDMELAPSGNTTITGDIAANGSIYMGASLGPPAGTLTLNNTINYLAPGHFNQAEVDTTNPDGSITPTLYTSYRKPGTWNAQAGALVPATGDALTLLPPTIGNVATQVSAMTEPENILGGLDASTIAADRPDLFGPSDNPTDTATATNNVYHAQITPPPALDPTDFPVAPPAGDDTRMSSQRAYNRASLIITVSPSGTVSYSTVASPGTPNRVETNTTSGNYPGVVAAKSMYDQREGKTVNVTQIDISALKTDLATNYPNFAGMLYINVQNGSSATPAAVRLVNGSDTPHDNGVGFSVVTNGGLYVEGDYNTVAQTVNGNTITNPAMLMGDAVTILSSAWNDANSGLAISNRVSSGNVTINSGILTGNVAAVVYDPVNNPNPTAGSGGAQNLVRFLEDWRTGGGSVTFNGSSGRLFNSTMFTGAFQTGAGAVNIYTPPTRNYLFDSSLQTSTPPGSPVVTKFSRGNFFVW